MIELTLVTLLQTMAPRFCVYKEAGYDTTKATLLAYSDMHMQYDAKEIKSVIKDATMLKELSVAIVATTCPLDAVK